MLSTIFLVVTNLLAAVEATSSYRRGRIPLDPWVSVPPKQDPWYTAPEGYENASPGDILRIRAAPGNILVTVPNAYSAYNILYRSTDSRSLPSWAVTTLLVPENAATGADGPNALLSYQVAYDSADLDASPSYSLSSSSSGGGHGHGPPSYVADLEEALAFGWYVTVPDYEGPLAAFTAGLQSGQATLDAIRATLVAGKGLARSESVRIAITGYSGGALAGEWAAELQSSYAPELNISGIAIGGLTPNIFNVLKVCSHTVNAGLDPSGVVGLISQFPDVSDYVISKLKPTGKHNASTFLSVRNMTIDEAGPTFAFQNIFEYFIDGILDLENPLVQNLTNTQGRMGYHGVPVAPLFVYKAIHDEISHIEDSDDLIDKYCAAGAKIVYERNTVGSHGSEQQNGHQRAFVFLSQVLKGTYVPPTGCVIKNVTIGGSPGGPGGGGGNDEKPPKPFAFSLDW